MVLGTKHVEKDAWSSVSYGWTCGHFEQMLPSIRGSEDRWPSVLLQPRLGTRPMSKPSTPPEANLAKLLDKLKANEHFKGSEELAAMQVKAEKACEADKLAKRDARTPETAVHSVSTALQRDKAAQAKEQAKLVESEEAAKAAVEAVEEAKQKSVTRQEEIDGLQAEYDLELARLVPTSDSVAHHQKSLRDTFHALASRLEARSLITHLDAAVAAVTRTTPSPTPLLEPSLENEGGALTSGEREAKKQKFQALLVEESDL